MNFIQASYCCNSHINNECSKCKGYNLYRSHFNAHLISESLYKIQGYHINSVRAKKILNIALSNLERSLSIISTFLCINGDIKEDEIQHYYKNHLEYVSMMQNYKTFIHDIISENKNGFDGRIVFISKNKFGFKLPYILFPDELKGQGGGENYKIPSEIIDINKKCYECFSTYPYEKIFNYESFYSSSQILLRNDTPMNFIGYTTIKDLWNKYKDNFV